jgi:hypothetical protein
MGEKEGERRCPHALATTGTLNFRRTKELGFVKANEMSINTFFGLR